MDEERARIFLPFNLLIAIAAVSTASVFVRFAQRDAPSLVIAALRLTFASLALAPIALTRYREELRKLTRNQVILGLLSGTFLAIHFATWISSLEYTSVASSVVLVSTGPLWVALLSPILLKEPQNKAVLIGMSSALLGVTLIGLDTSLSMKQHDAGGETRLDAAKNLLQTSGAVTSSGMPTGPLLRLFEFSDDARPVQKSVLDLVPAGKTTLFHKSVGTMLSAPAGDEAVGPYFGR